MKHFRLALVAFVSLLGLARAQDDENRAPPTEIPDFSNLDDYVIEPKSVLTFGFRTLSGAKTSFSGTGKLPAREDAGPATGTNVKRSYHDGSVSPDTRVAGRTDGSGNPVIDLASGGQVNDPIAPDGHTNTWSYIDNLQITPDGNVAFHTYSADVIDSAVRQNKANSTSGIEVAVSRDMGNAFHTKATWKLLAGVSLNDILSKTSDHVQAAITTLTDTYSLDGQAVPGAPYNAPSSTSFTVVDSAGNQLLKDDGSTQTVTIDNTTLLGSQPANRSTNTVVDSTTVTNRWELKGAYYTFRAGPTLLLPVTSRLHFSFSAGVAVIVAGTYYTVTQTFQPEIGGQITDTPEPLDHSDTNTSSTYKVMPGYFADASMQFDLTEHAGFYAGAVFQSAGSYDQKLETDVLDYRTKVDLTRQQGLRAGMTIRF